MQTAIPVPRFSAVLCVSVGLLGGCGGLDRPGDLHEVPTSVDIAYTEAREPCRSRDPLRRPLFGELHVHTTYSMDANLWTVRTTPDDAYRFARGGELALAPYDRRGNPLRRTRLERRLDFAAVTDHASFLGEVSLCTRKGSDVYRTRGCRLFRGEISVDSPLGEFGSRMSGLAGGTFEALAPSRVPELCGEDGARCRAEVSDVWRSTVAAAERWYDRTEACRFTTFPAYEYTATPQLSKVHRNVIFRNETVPSRPLSWIDEPTALGLWRGLQRECLDAGTGCDVLAIPHNSNLSNGRMFTAAYESDTTEGQRAEAALRAELEPLAEIMQIKGDSECRNGMFGVRGAADELCGFEKFRIGQAPDCETGTGVGALRGQGCQSRLDFVRYTLVEGLREAERLGVNPHQLGIIAATDAHNTNPGDTEEYSYDGWAGARDASVVERLGGDLGAATMTNLMANPGGLAGVWAEENSRDAIFEALRRRETFGTSGTRLTARFFGGWEYPSDVCDSANLVARGYRGGVPMGGTLVDAPRGAAPTFIVMAHRDPGTQAHPGASLQRAQVIKGWVGDDGAFHQAIYDVAGSPDSGAGVDLETCLPTGRGSDSLCSVWRDPDFDPARRAVYYVRVVESPSCRWHQHHCIGLPKSRRPPVCDGRVVAPTIQERLWTSPIWYAPTG